MSEQAAKYGNRMKTKEAAKIMGVSEQFIRIGLRQGILPFGVAIKLRTKKRESEVHTYYINPKQFFDYLENRKGWYGFKI